MTLQPNGPRGIFGHSVHLSRAELAIHRWAHSRQGGCG